MTTTDTGQPAARTLRPGERFPDLVLPDHDGHPRRISELAGGDPLVLHTYRGWWRQLADLQDAADAAGGEEQDDEISDEFAELLDSVR